MQDRRFVALLVLASVFSVFLGLTLFHRAQAIDSQLRPMQMHGQWITTASSSNACYFRKTIRLTSNVKNAWIVVSACDAYEVSVNRNPMGRQYLWRPTRPFNNGMSEKGQRLTSDLSALALNFPREYQWDGHDSWRVPQFIDLTASFRQGKNVICIEVESRSLAKACFHGEVELWNGEKIPIRSDTSWCAEAVPPGLQSVDWTDPSYREFDWSHARVTDPPSGRLWRTLDPSLFATPFGGQWLRNPSSRGDEPVWFEKVWSISKKPEEAWLRLATNRQFVLFINDVRVGVSSTGGSELDSGDWVLGRQRALDPMARPELLDPDEVGAMLAGKRFESPRHADPRLENFAALSNLKETQHRKERATDRSEMPGEFDPIKSLAETRRTPRTEEGFPERVTPKALSRDHLEGGYLAYTISRLLRRGDNKVAIRLCAPDSQRANNWAPQVAFDGVATMSDGERVELDSSGWTCKKESAAAVPALLTGPALNRSVGLPAMQYRGMALAPAASRAAWPRQIAVTAAAVLGLLFLLVGFLSGRKPNELARHLFIGLLPATVVLIVALLLRTSFAERHEILFFMQQRSWDATLLLAAFLAVVAATLSWLGTRSTESTSRLVPTRDRVRLLLEQIADLPNTRLWKFAIVWMLMLCGFLRAYKLDYQPLDDDEYASTQAVLAIVETGVPAFVPDNVYYTRSPLFHYVTAGVAWLFGPDLWTLRLQTVGWSMATAWLAYVCGASLLRSPWVGFGALVLMAIHPFQIYTGHIIRFYQMQQFFALLTVYLFCKGFVDDQSQRYRYLTVAAFLAGVFSQEISVVIGVPLAIGFFLFAKDLGWKANMQLAVVAGAALAMIVLDYAVFQTRCLTRVEGVSPNLEAAVKPHFWQPYNFLAIYIGYSRLHLLLSAFLFAGLPLAWKNQNRNTLAMHLILLFGVALTNLLITHVSIRYQYWLIPIWILLSLDAIRSLLIWVVGRASDLRQHTARYAVSVHMCAAVIVVGVILSWSPWRIAGSYDTKILGDSTGAMRFVRSQLRPHDKVAATEPHTHCGFLEAGRIDFDISVPLLYDFSMNSNGKLIDRNGGAEVIGSLDQLMSACRANERVWILLNREKFRTRGKNLRWEYPGARFESYVRKNCELKHRTYLWSVYLWDANRGFYDPFRVHAG